MNESRPIRLFLLLGATPLALILACLGLETATSNLLGWLLALTGAGYLAGGAILLWVERRRWPPRGPEETPAREERGDRSFWLALPGFLGVFFGPPLEYLYLPSWLPRGLGMQIAGLALVGLGLLLRLWARRAIRSLYTGHIQVQAGHCLVQSGPYRYIRHPGYAGFLLAALGLALGYSSLVGLAALFALLLPGLAYRMWVEERLLEAQFGEAYRQYKMGTGRLIPKIW